jgi:hypothetical protein
MAYSSSNVPGHPADDPPCEALKDAVSDRRYRALWKQGLDALHTEVARGERERRSTR